MLNFSFHNPTRIHFGDSQVQKIANKSYQALNKSNRVDVDLILEGTGVEAMLSSD